MLGALVVLRAASASAAGPIGRGGAPITTSAYTLDVFQGPVLGSGRTTGLAGATGAIPEGALGNAVSSASPAAREPWSRDWLDWDADITLSLPSTLRKSDFDNNGRAGLAYEQLVYGSVGGLVQLGPWGISVAAESTTYTLGGATGQPRLDAALTRTRLVVARQFLAGALIVGAGVRGVDLDFASVSPSEQQQSVLKLSGASLQGGVLLAPLGKPFRLALEGRSAVTSNLVEGTTQPDAQGDRVITDPSGRRFFAPRDVRLPGEAELSFAYQLGGRPLNVPWFDPTYEEKTIETSLVAERVAFARDVQGRTITQAERKELADHARAIRRARDKDRYRGLPRQKLLLTASLLIAGAAREGVGVESFLVQTVERSGRRVSVVPRLGAEIEPWSGRLQARAGSYLEPSRFDQGKPRLHATAGVDLRVLEWNVFGVWDEGTRWRVGTFVDVAARYASISATLGIWH